MTKIVTTKKKPKTKYRNWIIAIISILLGFALALFTFWGLVISKVIFFLFLVCTAVLTALSFHFYLQSERKTAKYQKEHKKGNLENAKLKFKIQYFLSTLCCSLCVWYILVIVLPIIIMFRNHCSIISSHTAYEIMEEITDGSVNFNSLKYFILYAAHMSFLGIHFQAVLPNAIMQSI